LFPCNPKTKPNNPQNKHVIPRKTTTPSTRKGPQFYCLRQVRAFLATEKPSLYCQTKSFVDLEKIRPSKRKVTVTTNYELHWTPRTN